MDQLRNDPKLLADLDVIRQMFFLKNLYYVKADGNSVIFGARVLGCASPLWNEAEKYLKNFVGLEVKILDNPRDEVETLLEEMEPYIAADGGEIAIKEIREEEGLVILSLSGSCSGCPSSVMTLKHGIEVRLKECLPWVRSVEPDQPPVEPDFGFNLGGEA